MTQRDISGQLFPQVDTENSSKKLAVVSRPPPAPKPMHWFKHGHGTASDPTFGMIARSAGADVSKIFHLFTLMREHANGVPGDRRGYLDGFRFEMPAFILGVSNDAVRNMFDAMLGWLHDGEKITMFDSWNDEPPRREAPGASTARVRAMRDRQRSADETVDETACNACNGMKRAQSQSLDSESDSESLPPPPVTPTRASAEHDDSVVVVEAFLKTRRERFGGASARFDLDVLKREACQLLDTAPAAVVAETIGVEMARLAAAPSSIRFCWKSVANAGARAGAAAMAACYAGAKPETPETPETRDQRAVATWFPRLLNSDNWVTSWGPRPGMEGCRVPPRVIELWNERTGAAS